MTWNDATLNDYVQDILVRMVQTNSVNPELIPDAAGEHAMAHLIAQELEALGIEPIWQETAPNRPNIIGILRGTGGGRSLMLNAHTDTVGVAGMEAPFSGEVRDGKVWGRGSYDMKSGAAAMFGMAKALIESGESLAGDVILTFVTDEEASSIGTQAIVDAGYTADAAIVTEPTALRVCCGHRGFQEVSITVEGRSAHGSRPHLGLDANTRAGRVLMKLEALNQDLQNRSAHPLLGHANVHVPLMQGGSSRFVFASTAELHVEWRTLPHEDEATVEAELQALLDAIHSEDATFNATLKTFFSRPAYAIEPDAPIVQTVRQATAHITGKNDDVYGETWWMDSAILSRAGIDTVVIGAKGEGAHADVEWVDLQSVFDLTRILLDATRDFCGE
jgi:acetylornithine deacetylase